MCLLPYSEVDLVGVGGIEHPILPRPDLHLFGDAKKSASAVIEELEAL